MSDFFEGLRARRGALDARNANRALIARNFGQGIFGCSACAWTLAMPKVGSFGGRSGRARVAPVRGAFRSHKCELHPEVSE